MRSSLVTERALWVTTLVFGVFTLRTILIEPIFQEAADSARAPPLSPPSRSEYAIRNGSSGTLTAIQTVINRNPFSDGGNESALPPTPAGVHAPEGAEGIGRATFDELALVGVLGGPPWQALVEGIPGTAGSTPLRPGETAGGIRVVHIGGDSAIVESPDSSWLLRLSQP